ncbi:MAG: tyrosine-type recombinase/integrase [Clostridia bacterium]|nr:tyrosine-type recombinase/integrase [Clostridia bacterium]
MAAERKPLTNTQIEKARPQEKDYYLRDFDGLSLRVSTKGKKSWQVRLFIGGTERRITLGEYPVMTLQDARRERDDIKLKARTGKTLKFQKELFAGVAAAWFDEKQKTVTPEHAKCLKQRLDDYVLPSLGGRDIKSISRTEILDTLKPLVDRKVVATARRTSAIIAAIFAWAEDHGKVDYNVASDLGRSLPGWTPVNFKSVYDPAEIGKLLRAIDMYDHSAVRNALRMVAYTSVRRGELTQATWSEIDFDAALWTIPAEHTKRRREQVVPLSRQTLAILEDMKTIARRRWKYVKDLSDKPIFPAMRETVTGTPYMSRVTMKHALDWLRDNIPEPDRPPVMDVHGFRHMFSTLMNEHGWNHEAIERQLSHVSDNRTEATYNKSKLLPVRRLMMQWWADYLDALKTGAPEPEKPQI